MPVSIASSEKTVCPPGVVRRAARQPSSTSGVTHNVRLPRRRRPASYSAQLFTRNFILGMWRRRGELCLFGMEGAAFQESVPEHPIFNPIRATTPGKRVRLGCLGGALLRPIAEVLRSCQRSILLMMAIIMPECACPSQPAAVRRVIGAMMHTPALVLLFRSGKLAKIAGPIKRIAAQKGIPAVPPIDLAPSCRYHKGVVSAFSERIQATARGHPDDRITQCIGSGARPERRPADSAGCISVVAASQRRDPAKP